MKEEEGEFLNGIDESFNPTVSIAKTQVDIHNDVSV